MSKEWCFKCCFIWKTTKEWRNNNKDISDKGNIRDYTDLLHLIILNNLENINAESIEMKLPQRETYKTK